MKIGFIGAGKVGFTLGKYFTDNKINVTGYFSKNSDSARKAAEFTNTNYFNSLEDVIKSNDIIFITTPDGVIKEIWNFIKKLAINKKIICHCSGSLSSNIFSNIEQVGAYGYSIHPMYAFSDKYNSHINFKEATITIEGSEKYTDFLSNLFKKLGNNIKIISRENKSIYHAASVVVSNHVVGLVQFGVNLLENCGFTSEEALKALFPLINNNIINIGRSGVVNSLTGPVERGDVETVKKHLESLNKEDRELYRLLTKKVLEIAKVKNKDRDYSNFNIIMEE